MSTLLVNTKVQKNRVIILIIDPILQTHKKGVNLHPVLFVQDNTIFETKKARQQEQQNQEKMQTNLEISEAITKFFHYLSLPVKF